MSVSACVQEIESFCNRWKHPVFGFCHIFLGSEGAAEESTSLAFVDYFREHDRAFDMDALPPALLEAAFCAVRKRCHAVRKTSGCKETLEEAVLVLPCNQRAVFILRTVLGLDAEVASKIMGLSSGEIVTTWMAALLRLRTLLPKRFFKEKGK